MKASRPAVALSLSWVCTVVVLAGACGGGGKGGGEGEGEAEGSPQATARKVDVLWVVDNSNSMCQEQANLTRNFESFVRQLSPMDADFKMGVITTDVVDPKQDGQLQNTPATNQIDCIRADFQDEANYCQDDDHCGTFGCLCGVPHVQTCTTDDDCPVIEPRTAPACVRSSAASSYSFCSRSCNGAGDESCLDPAAPNGVFTCGSAPEKQGNYCLLRTCTTPNDCPAATAKYEYACMAHSGEAGVSYCRRLENYNFPCNQGRCPLGKACTPATSTCPAYAVCPAPTCDCPKSLPDVLEIKDMAEDDVKVQAAVRAFRCMATTGTQGSPIERGLEAIDHFAERDKKKPADQQFLRMDAHLVIVILSDEDDCSGHEKLPQTLGLSVCVWFRDQLNTVASYVDKVKKLKTGDYKVAVATIVGAQDLRCVSSCPTPDGQSCAESEVCPADEVCPLPNFCAERVYLYDQAQGKGEDPGPSCTSANGKAFAGDRYLQFASAFGENGLNAGVCEESYAPALEALVRKMALLMP